MLDPRWPWSCRHGIMCPVRSISRVTEMDWHAWHDGYDELGTRLARRAHVQVHPPTSGIKFHPERAGRVPPVLPRFAWVARPAGSLRPVSHPRGDLAA